MESKGTNREALKGVLAFARGRFAERPGWLEFTDEVNTECRARLGGGLSRFVGPEVREIHWLTIQLALLRPSRQERMITVRLPRRLHDLLKREADQRSTNLNCLAVAKLLQPLPGSRSPAEREAQETGKAAKHETLKTVRKLAVDQPGVYLAIYQPPKQRPYTVLVQVSGEAPLLQVDWAFAVGTRQPTCFTPNLLDLEFYNQVVPFVAV
jgi:hypothetical protein